MFLHRKRSFNIETPPTGGEMNAYSALDSTGIKHSLNQNKASGGYREF